MSPQLPVELWEGIVSFCASEALLSLCSTSQHLKPLAIRAFYRDISFTTPKQIVCGCRTLTSNRDVAPMVRKFRITLKHSDDSFSSLQSLIYTNLGLLTNVEELYYYLESGSIPECLLPHLRLLVYGPPYSASTTTFLIKNPTIEVVQFQSGHVFAHTTCIASGIPLPRLISFMGPSQVLKELVLGSCVNDALIGWEESVGVQHYDDALKALGPSAQHMDRLGSSSVSWDERLLPIIAERFPNLPNLRFHVQVVDRHTMNETLEACLPRMTNLRRFVLAQFHSPPLTADICEQDMQSIRSWGDICPTLNSCHLPSGTTWLRLDRSIWLPTNSALFVSNWWSETVSAGLLDDAAAGSKWVTRDEGELNISAVTLSQRRGLLIDVQARLAESKR